MVEYNWKSLCTYLLNMCFESFWIGLVVVRKYDKSGIGTKFFDASNIGDGLGRSIATTACNDGNTAIGCGDSYLDEALPFCCG